MAGLFRRKPVLLGADALPAGFAYPDELVGLIAAQRNFQANAKALETDTTLLQTIINLR